MPPTAFEINFDGLAGPTHNHAGLAPGNLASTANRAAQSSPRRAALQGLAKMKALLRLGLRQGLLPPHERPDVAALRARGFSGDDAAVLAAVRRREPELLASVCSSSPMWAANSATVTPSVDAADGRVHFTTANLASNPHRALEASTTERVLRAIFRDGDRFVIHPPLPSRTMPDEGAANHSRFCAAYGAAGAHLFVFGRSAGDLASAGPARFPARQTLEASQAVAAAHGLRRGSTLFLRQSPAAIDAGAFHNDVVAVGNQHVHLFHEQAFADGAAAVVQAVAAMTPALGREPVSIAVPAVRVSLDEAVRSYLFNSQLVTMPDGAMALLMPRECEETEHVRDFVDELVGAGRTPIRRRLTFDLGESMRNGGGPACLRLRVVLNEQELAAVAPGALMTESGMAVLETWVERHYRDRLCLDDLADPALLDESRAALDELTRILGLGSLYPFQT